MLAPTQRATRTRLYEKALGAVIWLVFAGVGIGALYACSKLAGD